jgi:hypothetical protein
MSDKWFVPVGLVAAVCLASLGVWLWGLILGWWSS